MSYVLNGKCMKKQDVERYFMIIFGMCLSKSIVGTSLNFPNEYPQFSLIEKLRKLSLDICLSLFDNTLLFPTTVTRNFFLFFFFD